MSKLPIGQRYYWAGEYFATCCLLQSGVITSFTSLYVVPTASSSIIKERVWENGELLSTQEIAVKPFYLQAVNLFLEEVDSFNRRMFRRYAARKNRTMNFPIKTRSPLKWRTPEMGEAVTCLRPIEAYSSGYAGRPQCFFEPGDIGVIGAVDVPAVYHNPENRSDLFACVDFDKPDISTSSKYSTTIWRCSMYYHHMVHLSRWHPRAESSVAQSRGFRL